MVRRLFAIFFLILLISSTETGIQLMKLPLLISHFNAHISEGRINSFTDFLAEHYSLEHQNDSDSRQDNQLPFKSASPDAFTSLYVPFAQPVITVQQPRIAVKNIQCNCHFTLQDYMAGIFHPPKIG